MTARKVANRLARHDDIAVRELGLGAWEARLHPAMRAHHNLWPRIVTVAPGGGRHVMLTGRAAGLLDNVIVSRVPAEDAADLALAWLRWES